MILVLVIIILSTASYAATPLYVDPTATDDTGSGLIGDPKKTISAAYAAVDDGGVVKLVDAGTYNDASQIWGITIAAKSVTIEPAAAGGRITITRESEGATSLWWYVSSDRTGYNTTFNNIDFVDERSGAGIFYWASDSGHNFICDTCSLTVASGARVLNSANSPNVTYERRFQATDCTFNVDNTNTPFNFRGMTLVDINGGSFANPSTSTTLRMMRVTDAIGPTYFRNITFTAKYPLWIESYNSSNTVTFIEDCTFTDVTEQKGTAAGLGPLGPETPSTNTVEGVVLTGNKIVGFDIGIQDTANTTHITDNIFDCSDSILFFGTYKPYIKNNTFVVKANTGAGDTPDRSIMFGRNWMSDYTVKANTTFTATTVVSSAAWNLAHAVADDMSIVGITSTNTGTPLLLYYGLITIVNDGTDTVTVAKWIDVSNGNVVTPADATYHAIALKWSTGAYVINNIMDGALGTGIFTFDFNPVPGDHIMDYNCYVAGSNGFSNLGSTSQADLSALQAKWAAWPMDTYGLAGKAGSWYVSPLTSNDENSLEEDPLLDDDYVPHNLALKLDDNTWIGGVQPVAGDGSSGALYNGYFNN